MIRIIAIGFGAIMLIAGVLGFVPGITHDGLLFGIFAVNAVHNVIHLVTGIAALAVSKSTEKAMRLFFQLFGVVYGLVAISGLFMGDKPLLGLVAVNHADHALHAGIALFSLIVGFAFGNQRWRIPNGRKQTTVAG